MLLIIKLKMSGYVILNKMVKELEGENGRDSNSKQICLSALLTSDFELKLTNGQIQQILNVFTQEQLDQINKKLDDGCGWF